MAHIYSLHILQCQGDRVTRQYLRVCANMIIIKCLDCLTFTVSLYTRHSQSLNNKLYWMFQSAYADSQAFFHTVISPRCKMGCFLKQQIHTKTGGHINHFLTRREINFYRSCHFYYIEEMILNFIPTS